ncbi:DUF4429 domain-containing protein [Rhodococcus zopfii]|uniref:DUF4429 domain-containing protein n=1 Tax=Rhodococcus zopfii TaxID=43772 RepID=UPI000932B6A7|nr:DUF4429 domain-containing protein [Rhodococcus zopfii]
MTVPPTDYPLWGCRPDRIDTEVEAEFAWTDNIIRVLGPAFSPTGARIQRTVALIPEPHAVSVRADGLTVGVLADGDAIRYSAALQRVVDGGSLPTVPARIWAADAGAYNRDPARDGRIIARVSIALAAPARLAPYNDPPDAEYTLLPAGRTLQVTGENEHLDVLGRYVEVPGKYALMVTLHPAPDDAVEVRVDGRRCGQLGRRSSAHLLPIVMRLAERDLVTAARGAVAGSAASAEVTVSVAPVEAIGDVVLDGPPVTVPRLGTAAARTPPDPVAILHRYHGYAGQIVVQDDRLWILREGVVARTLGELSPTPRRIRLSDVTDVQFRPAMPRTAGLIRVVTAANAGGVAAPGDPDTVVFHHRDRQRFQALAEWLRHVAAANAGPPA